MGELGGGVSRVKKSGGAVEGANGGCFLCVSRAGPYRYMEDLLALDGCCLRFPVRVPTPMAAIRMPLKGIGP